MKQVALLVGLLLAAQRTDPEAGAALLAEERVDRATTRKDALLHGCAEEVARLAGADAVRAQDPHPPLR